MNLRCALVAAFSTLGTVAPSNPPIGIVLTPLKRTLVRGEPLYLLITLTGRVNAPVAVPSGTVRGVWEHRRADGNWETCHRKGMADERLLAEVTLQAALTVRPGESKVLGIIGPRCLERKDEGRIELRLRGESECCGTSNPAIVVVTPGSPADSRARSAGNDRTAHVDSVLVGYNFLHWRDLNRLYEDPALSFKEGNYQFLQGHELDESIARMLGFLKNFPSFPFAQSIRLRLATELALVGRFAEARAQLRRITGTPQEPHVVEDARRLEAAIRASGGKAPSVDPPRPASKEL